MSSILHSAQRGLVPRGHSYTHRLRHLSVEREQWLFPDILHHFLFPEQLLFNPLQLYFRH